MNVPDRIVIQNDRAPCPIGPYSQAIRAGQFIFVSGQLGLDPKTGELVGPDAASQTRMILKHLEAILQMANIGLARVVKTTIFLVDLADFAAVNKIYAEHFPIEPPARSTIQVVALPKGARVEIEVLAALPAQSATELSGGLLV